jgi:hypothetical protein
LELFAGFAAKAFWISFADYGSFSRSGHSFTLGLGLGFGGIESLSGGACNPLAIEFELNKVTCHARILPAI